MKTYLVGGAVRDQLLGIEVTERDWVVVGATVKDMEDQNYQQVGKNFPVFLHPDTKEEYALARTERKDGSGHTGFQVHTSSEITLDEDLLRRDLTINAIAKDQNGRLIDPYNGLGDINNRLLKHVSNAFIEDPLRVLRVARFHAKLSHLGFTVADQTLTLMKEISASGELKMLPPERVWKEFQNGLNETSPHDFILTLYKTGALEQLLPELDRCFHNTDNMLDVENNIGNRTLSAIEYASKQNYSVEIRWAITLHAIDTKSRPKNLTAKTINTKLVADNLVKKISTRLTVPNNYNAIANLVAYYIDLAIQAKKLKPDMIISLLDVCDAWRRPDQFHAFLQGCEALISTSPEKSHQNLGSIAFLRMAYELCSNIDAKEFIAAGISGEAIGASIRNARKICIAELKQQF